MFRSITGVRLSCSFGACTRVIWVKKGTPETAMKVPGIPFFVKKQQFKQTSVYSKTWLRATLTVEEKLVDAKTGAFVSMGNGKEVYIRDVTKPNAPTLGKEYAAKVRRQVIEGRL